MPDLVADPIHLSLALENNALAAVVFGAHDTNLSRLEAVLGIAVASRGNGVTISGPEDKAIVAHHALRTLAERARGGADIDFAEVDAAVRMAEQHDTGSGPTGPAPEDLTIRTRKRSITPRSPNQAAYIRTLRACELVFALGPAGTGKTYMAVAQAVSLKLNRQIDRIILSRPAVEAGERLGFLPGDLREKVDPYLRPLYDALHDMLPGDTVLKAMESGEIEVAPLAFMRGRTLSNAFVILDEAQNTTPTQMKMFLTRLGENSRMVVTGDLSQIDLPPGTKSGLKDALEVLDDLPGIGQIHFTRKDVLRHDLVARMVQAYEERDRHGKDATP